MICADIRRIYRRLGRFGLVLGWLAGSPAVAQEAPNPNLPLPTLGGRQLWTDLEVSGGWRLQEHVWTGHTRILDPADVRRCWGPEAACGAEMGRLAPGPGTEPVVVLVHGLGRSRATLTKMAEALEAAGHHVERFEYASTRATMPDHAAALDRVLTGLAAGMPAGQRRAVAFVTHSLGELVVRAALDPAYGWQAVMEPQRAVFLAPPSQGSALAQDLWVVPPVRWVLGGGGAAALPDEAKSLPVPAFPFAVIAGGLGDDTGYNPWLEGDDDGLVAAAETELPGAVLWLQVQSGHTFIADNPEVIAATKAFLAAD